LEIYFLVTKTAKILLRKAPAYTKHEKLIFRDLILNNILYSLRCLIDHALEDETVSKEDKKFLSEVGIPTSDNLILHAADRTVLPQIPILWNHQAIAKAYKERNKTFHIPEIHQWMNDLDRILSPDYVPTISDILRSRVKTTGIVNFLLQNKNYDIELIDVGSERNERKKWHACFEDVTDLMYVVALDEYAMLCYEDNETNRLAESLECWTEICNAKFFNSSNVNLFLVFNKVDLFCERVLNGCDIRQCFPSYDDELEPNKILSFIVNIFLERIRDKHKRVYVFVTNALDLNCMKNFWKSLLSIPIVSSNIEILRNACYNDILLKKCWHWNLNQSVYKLIPNNTRQHDREFSPLQDPELRPCFSIISYSDINYSDLSFQYFCDMNFVTRDRPNMVLQAHSFVLSVRSPKFYQMLLNWNDASNLKRKEHSVELIVLNCISFNILQHILNLIYNNSFYPYSLREDKSELNIICDLNSYYNFTDKSNSELADLFNKIWATKSSYEKAPVSPIKRISKKLKNKGKNVWKQLAKSNNSSLYLYPTKDTRCLCGASKCTSIQNSEFDQFFSSILYENSDLANAFLHMNTGEKQYNSDLQIHGISLYDQWILRAHKFICQDVLPGFDGAKDVYMVIPFFSRMSYLNVLYYLYCGKSERFFESLLFKELSVQDLIYAIHISRLWKFDTSNTFFNICLFKLSSMLSIDNVLLVLKAFEFDYLDLSAVCGNLQTSDDVSTNVLSTGTWLTLLPNEIHLLIFSFLVPPLQTQQQGISSSKPIHLNNNLSVLNQDALTYMIFISKDFVLYVQQYYPEYLRYKTKSMCAYSDVRQNCFKFICKHLNEIRQQDLWQKISDETKELILDAVAKSDVTAI
jgi:guanine nucleotide-binding protein G(i) subunit alpha